VDLLENLFSTSGFIVNECRYLGYPEEPVPLPFRLDGRKWVGMIATKE